ncbi:MAG: heme biosynthesis protein HemY, partial [Alphaproteobacteria bacterium]
RMLIESGTKRPATRILKAAWQANPHPDLATAFAAIEPDEDNEARRKRFGLLAKLHPAHSETKMLLTELALAEEDFPTARRELGDLAEEQPTTRTLALMAAIEQGSGADESIVRALLAKALSASRGEQWVCSSCDHAHAVWSPTCERCNAFDTLEWTQSQQPDADAPMDAVLPLIVGARSELAVEEPEAVDAEISDEPSAS